MPGPHPDSVAIVPDHLDLRTTLAAVALQRDVVRIQGPEAIEFLQGQLSQDVARLAVGSTAPTLLLQPTGKVEAWLRITRTADDAALLDVEAGFGEAVAARLRRFKLRTKADIETETWSGLAVRGPGADEVPAPMGALALPAGWPGVEGVDLLSAEPLGNVQLPLADAAALEALRIEAGVPALGAELTEATIPAEAGAWLVEASVSWTKGCYTGQELVARVDSRGSNVPRPVRGLLVDGTPPAVGSEVVVDGGVVGTVTSSARSSTLGAVALAILGRAVLPGSTVEVRGPDGSIVPAAVAELPLR